MKYDRDTLRATAVQRIEEWAKYDAALKAREKADYDKQLAEWVRVDKPRMLERLAAATKDVKANRALTHSRYPGSVELIAPPSLPQDHSSHRCGAVSDDLQGLIDLLDTLSDTGISSVALSAAGFKDLRRLLRVPC